MSDSGSFPLHLHSVSRSWLRLVVEKPFGNDLASSEELANDISKHYSEDQVCSKFHRSHSAHSSVVGPPISRHAVVYVCNEASWSPIPAALFRAK